MQLMQKYSVNPLFRTNVNIFTIVLLMLMSVHLQKSVMYLTNKTKIYIGKTSFYETQKRILKILGVYSLSSPKLKAACHCHGVTHCLLCNGLCLYNVRVLFCFKLLYS